MVSARGGLYGKLKQAVNSKLFFTHCPPYRLILASKAGQKVLPGDNEKTVADVLYFFKDSSVRHDEFSFSDCVSRLVKLLHLLVRYFDEQALDTSTKARGPNEMQIPS